MGLPVLRLPQMRKAAPKGSLLPIWGRIWAAPTISSTLMPRFAHWHMIRRIRST